LETIRLRQEVDPVTSMTWPDHLLSLAEWDELPEDVSRRFELVEGMLQTRRRRWMPGPVGLSRRTRGWRH
jgi:hypothetical protein